MNMAAPTGQAAVNAKANFNRLDLISAMVADSHIKLY